MRTRIAAAMLGVAMIGAPAVAQADKERAPGYERAIKAGLETGDYKPYEERYLRLYNRFADEFGVQQAGRNVVLFGALTSDGVREASRDRVVGSAARFQEALRPAPVETTEQPATTTTETTETGGAPTSVIECESGGDYGAVNPAGYYGAYQFDQQTWDAYAPSGYAGSNPASAPPAVQDQAAANVDYDAWPNC